MILAGEAVATVAQPIWPRDERLAASSGTPLVHTVTIQHVVAAGPVGAQRPPNLDDPGTLVSMADLNLLTRGVGRLRMRGVHAVAFDRFPLGTDSRSRECRDP
jgi:hypothetical protein